MIPRWIDSLLKAQSPVINGDGETSRDFCYIKDVVQANILGAVCERPQALNRPYNVACGTRTTLNQLLSAIKESLLSTHPGVDVIQPVYGPFRQGDVRHSLADISRLKDLLGFEPAYSVTAGLEESIQWYVQNAKE